MPHSSGNDWLMLDRVIDMPVEQDVLTWDAFEPGRSEGIMLISGLNLKSSRLLLACNERRMWITC